MRLQSPAGPRVRPRASALLVLFLVSACSPSAPEQAAPNRPAAGARVTRTASGPASGSTLRALTGGRTRIVWVSDVGDGADVFARGDQLVLMRLDTADPTERPLLGTPSSYAKPLITPSGDRVVFSDRQRKKVLVVDWAGTGLRELAEGFALATWRDPEDGSDWVYFGSYDGQIEEDSYQTVRRTRLDGSGSSELVWNKTPVGEDNFQLSADGRRAGAMFPWPHAGVAELPNVGWRKYADGCWTALAPDNSYRFWHFDGAHRHLVMQDADGTRRWSVDVSRAPGIDGHEIYHPRWSNHPRVMTLTGPYKLGGGQNRIGRGGPAVEVYVGRFSTDFTAVTEWMRVTHNERADFLPDVWIETTDAVVPAGAAGVTPASSAGGAGHGEEWPVDSKGLVFVWENQSRLNAIVDPLTDTRWFGRVEPHGLARFGRHFDMDLAGGAFVADGAGPRVVAAARAAGALTLEALVTPRARQIGRIASLCRGGSSDDFALTQKDDRLLVYWRTDAGGPDEGFPIGSITPHRPLHLIVSYEPGRLVAYLDGERRFTTDRLRGGPDTWSATDLVFGGGACGGAAWDGLLEGVAVHARAIGAGEARRRFDTYTRRLKNRTPAARIVLEARVLESSVIPTPASIAPYRRALVANRYQVVRVLEGRYDRPDMMVAHWAILDERVLSDAQRDKGRLYRMTVEAFDDHPELEGERLVMDSDAFELALYYDVGR